MNRAETGAARAGLRLRLGHGRRRAAAGVLLVLAGLVGGCASPPRTNVVLLPDADGHVGAVVVSNAAGAQTIDRAWASASVRGAAAPAPAAAAAQQDVETRYAPLLQAQPTQPASFVLFFVLDSTELTAESRQLLPVVQQAARERRPTRITIFGHADASGTERRNLQLSEARARIVGAALRKAAPEIDEIEIQFFGDRVPLVADGDPYQPRNRRAEIVIL